HRLADRALHAREVPAVHLRRDAARQLARCRVAVHLGRHRDRAIREPLIGAAGAHATVPSMPQRAPNRKAQQSRREFLRHFPEGFRDETYLAWERDYKVRAHEAWLEALGPEKFEERLDNGDHALIASDAVRIESRTNLLFSFEKMALRDAVKSPAGAKQFAAGLYDFLYGDATPRYRFEHWCVAVASLPRRQTRVLTWPIATVFGFLAQPKIHFFLKPIVTRSAFSQYGLPFASVSRPNGTTYSELLALTRTVKRDLAAMRPRDLTDIQSFL